MEKFSYPVYTEFYIIHNVFDRGVLQVMWQELAGQVVHTINSLSVNHAYLKTLYIAIR